MIDHELLYEHLTLIVEAFEEFALRNGGRVGATVVAAHPIVAGVNMLERAKEAIQESRTDDRSVAERLRDDGQADFNLDLDLLEIMHGSDNIAAEYLKECLGCQNRLKFNWQLKPIELLAGIKQLIAGFSGILDSFALNLDPYKQLEGFCRLMNALKGFCIPDLVIVLMSLKMSLRQYISDAIKIRVDWTMVIAPIVNLVVDGIAALMQSIIGVMLAPLDCAITSLKASEQLYRQAKSFAQNLEDFKKGTSDQAKDYINSIKEGRLPQETRFDLMQRRIGMSPDPVLTPTGSMFTRGTTMEEVLRDANFSKTSPIQKLLLPVEDAKGQIIKTSSKIMQALRSLQGLTGEGMKVQMGKIGVIMFLNDMISIVVMIIKLLQNNRDIADWCTELEERPELLEEMLRARYNDNTLEVSANVLEDRGELLVRKGPQILTKIPTCSNADEDVPDMVQEWINQLNVSGVV